MTAKTLPQPTVSAIAEGAAGSTPGASAVFSVSAHSPTARATAVRPASRLASDRPQAVSGKTSSGKASSGEPMVLLRGVTKRYEQGGGGLWGIDLSLPQGGFLFVTGPSGSGKTTLLKLLYGAERPTQGSICVNQQPLEKLKGDRLSRFRRQLGVVFQDYKLIPNRTVAENVAFVLWAQGCPQAEVNRRLLPTLRLVGLQPKADCFPGQLSGGEQQRVSLARAIVGTPPLLLADEPTGNLDPDNSRQVLQILNKLNQMGVTVVVTTHDEHLVSQSPHPVIELSNGKLTWRRRQAG